MKPSSAARRRGPPLQRWLTFLRNRAPNIADMDLFVVPTIGLDLLYVLVSCGWDAAACLDQRHTESNCGVDRTPDHGGIPLE